MSVGSEGARLPVVPARAPVRRRSYGCMRAPFSGIVISKDAQPGEMISPVSAGGGFTRTGICTIVDMESLEIEVDVNEAYINRVTPNQRIEAVLDAYPDWRIPGHVITAVPTADGRERQHVASPALVAVVRWQVADRQVRLDVVELTANLRPNGN